MMALGFFNFLEALLCACGDKSRLICVGHGQCSCTFMDVTKWTTHLGGIVAWKKSNGECG